MGRAKGTPNKKTVILEETIERLGMNPVEGLHACLKELNLVVCKDQDSLIVLIKAKATIYLELMQYLYPKRKALEFKPASDATATAITLHWADHDPTPEETDSSAKKD